MLVLEIKTNNLLSFLNGRQERGNLSSSPYLLLLALHHLYDLLNHLGGVLCVHEEVSHLFGASAEAEISENSQSWEFS